MPTRFHLRRKNPTSSRHVQANRRSRDRAPDPAPGQGAGARAAFGAARRASSHQEEGAAAGAARRRHGRGGRQGARLLDLRQCRYRSIPASICTDPRRDGSTIIVVEDVADLWALERAGAMNARFHVLGGTLSPLDGIGPDQLNISALVARVADGGVSEVDHRRQRHRRGPDHRALPHRPACRFRGAR